MGLSFDIAPTSDCGAQHGVVHAFEARQKDVLQYGNLSGPLDTHGFSVGLLCFDATDTPRPTYIVNPQHGDPSYTLHTTSTSIVIMSRDVADDELNHNPISVAFNTKESGKDASVELSPTLRAESGDPHAGGRSAVATQPEVTVRRLTPVECERLQGFPDNYTAIAYRGKTASQCPDGPRYKALGNSWAVPVVRWIGQRIDAQLKTLEEDTTMKLFAIKKTRKTGECAAMRCTDPSTRDCPFDELWQTSDTVELCDRHMTTASAYAETLTQGAAIVQSSPQLPSTWVQTAAQVVRKIQDSEQEATETLQALAEIRVDSHEDLECVNECLRDTKTRRNEIKASEDGVLAPVKQLLKQISDMTTPAKKAWEQVEGTLRGIVSAAALAEAERNRKLAQQAAEAHAEGSDAVALLGRMTTATDLQGTSVKIVWVAVVEDASKLPDAYIERRVNQQALKAYADSFEGREPSPLPGVSFVQDAALRVRSR